MKIFAAMSQISFNYTYVSYIIKITFNIYWNCVLLNNQGRTNPTMTCDLVNISLFVHKETIQAICYIDKVAHIYK